MPIEKRSKEERAKSAAKVREAIYTTTPSHGKPGAWGKEPGTFKGEVLEPELEIVAVEAKPEQSVEEMKEEVEKMIEDSNIPEEVKKDIVVEIVKEEVKEQLEESPEETAAAEVAEPIVEEAVVETPVEEVKVVKGPLAPGTEEYEAHEAKKAEIIELQAKLDALTK